MVNPMNVKRSKELDENLPIIHDRIARPIKNVRFSLRHLPFNKNYNNMMKQISLLYFHHPTRVPKGAPLAFAL
jgi:hypothetical protein